MKHIFDFILYLLAVFVGIFKEKKKRLSVGIFILVSIFVFGFKLFINFSEDKNKRKQMGTLSSNVDGLLIESKQKDEKLNELIAKFDRQNEKIEQQNERLKKLYEMLMSQFLEKQEGKPDVYAKAKKLYELGITLASQGKNKEAAEAFSALRKIAIDQKNYVVAAEISIIAAWRFEDTGEKIKSARLKEEAGDFYMKIYDIDGLEIRAEQAKKWKIQAAEIYQKEGLEDKANQLYKSIEQLNNQSMKRE